MPEDPRGEFDENTKDVEDGAVVNLPHDGIDLTSTPLRPHPRSGLLRRPEVPEARHRRPEEPARDAQRARWGAVVRPFLVAATVTTSASARSVQRSEAKIHTPQFPGRG